MGWGRYFAIGDFFGASSRIELLRTIRTLRSYWTITGYIELTVVFDYYGPKETYSRIGLLRAIGTGTVVLGQVIPDPILNEGMSVGKLPILQQMRSGKLHSKRVEKM